MEEELPDEMIVKSTRLWLKAIKKNRCWLAEKIGVSSNSVSSWLHSGRRIPKQHRETVAVLMKKFRPEKTEWEDEVKRRGCSQILIEMDKSLLDVVMRASFLSGISFNLFVRNALKEYSEDVLSDIITRGSISRNREL